MTINQDVLLDNLRRGPVTVKFTKTDGTVREMNCTLHESYLPPRPETTRTKRENPDVQSVWDIDVNGWRSFRWDSLISEDE